MALTKPTHTVPPSGLDTNKRAPIYAYQVDDLFDAVNNIIDGDNLTVPGNLDVTGDLTITGTTTINGDMVLGDAAADSLEIKSTVTYDEVVNYSNATGITAFATGGQASATALTEEISNVTTVATAGDSVKLKSAVAGAHQHVKNSGATALAIFPATGDSIDALAVNLAIWIQPGSSVDFYAKDATVWESNIDQSLTLVAPTTLRGGLEIKAADSAGNTVTTITNASMGQATTVTVPDPGAATANFVLSEGTQTINGAKTFGTGIALPDGLVSALSVRLGADGNNGLYGISDTQMGIAVEATLVATADTLGLTADSLRNRVNLGTTPVGTVSIVEYADGKDTTTVLTLTNFIVGALAGAAANLGVGNIVYAFPAGQHFELVYSLSSIVLTAAGTPVATDTGLGSVIASGAVAVLSGTGTFEDRLTGQTINTAPTGGAAVSALTAATAGIGTGISLNVSGSVKNVFLNSAGAWNADNTGNLTASGTIVLKWTRMQ